MVGLDSLVRELEAVGVLDFLQVVGVDSGFLREGGPALDDLDDLVANTKGAAAGEEGCLVEGFQISAGKVVALSVEGHLMLARPCAVRVVGVGDIVGRAQGPLAR